MSVSPESFYSIYSSPAVELANRSVNQRLKMVIGAFDDAYHLKQLFEKMGCETTYAVGLFPMPYDVDSLMEWPRNAMVQIGNSVYYHPQVDAGVLRRICGDHAGRMNFIATEEFSNGGTIIPIEDLILVPEGTDLDRASAIFPNDYTVSTYPIPSIQDLLSWYATQTHWNPMSQAIEIGRAQKFFETIPDGDCYFGPVYGKDGNARMMVNELYAAVYPKFADFIRGKFETILADANESSRFALNFVQTPDRTVVLPGPSPITVDRISKSPGLECTAVQLPWEWSAGWTKTGNIRCRTAAIETV